MPIVLEVLRDVGEPVGWIVAIVTMVWAVWKHGPAVARWVSTFHGRYNARDQDVDLEKRTYFKYRDLRCDSLTSEPVVKLLAERYRCDPLVLGSVPLPVSILWRNDGKVIRPDSVLGTLDVKIPKHHESSAVLGKEDYGTARDFIRRKYEEKVKYEGLDYRMVSIDLGREVPVIHGAFGRYYDNILTQYALEWELKKALLESSENLERLSKTGSLPLREAVEAAARTPLVNGAGRCAAMTVSMLIVFQRETGEFNTIVRRRSEDVGVSAGLHHVVPAGMFEAPNAEDNWSLEASIWREFLEEVYDEKELIGTGRAEILDHLYGRLPISILRPLIRAGRAKFSVTGICCDLLTLRTEICAVLYVPTAELAAARPMCLNWEYEATGQDGAFAIRWDRMPQLMSDLAARRDLVVSGAACIELGRHWLEHHSLLAGDRKGPG